MLIARSKMHDAYLFCCETCLNTLVDFQAQFAMYVFPGETLRTEMWQEGPTTVVFQTRVVERDVLAITKAAVEFNSPSTAKL